MTPQRWTAAAVAAIAAAAIGCSSGPRAPRPEFSPCSGCQGIGDAPTGKATRKPAKPTTTHPTYKDCAALRQDHPNGVTKKHPAYRLKLDRDRDGRACEPDDE